MSKDDMFFLHPIDQHYNSQQHFFKNKLDVSLDSYNSEETELSLKFDGFRNTYNDIFEEYSPIKSLYESKESRSKFFPRKKSLKVTSMLKDDLQNRIEIHKFKAKLKGRFYITLMVKNYQYQNLIKQQMGDPVQHDVNQNYGN
jgi:hypothetical protein